MIPPPRTGKDNSRGSGPPQAGTAGQGQLVSSDTGLELGLDGSPPS